MTRLKDKPFAFLGVNCDRRRDAAYRFSIERGINWRSWWDGTGRISGAWHVDYLPGVFVLDANGVIRYKDLIDPRELEEAVERLLKEAEGSKAS